MSGVPDDRGGTLRYRLFGLAVESDAALPALRPRPADGPADVRIWIGGHPGDLPARFEPWYVSERTSASEAPALWISRNADTGWLRLRYADGVVVTVDAPGTRVGCTWPPDLTLQDAATYLLGPVCGLLLRLRRVTTLHACAVSIHGRAVLVCGPAGAGKSTLAAAMRSRGHRVLADDIAALDVTSGGVSVRAGYPHVKLWADSVRAVFGPGADLPALTPNWDKRYLDVEAAGDAFDESPLSVAAVYALGGREGPGAPRIEPLPPAERLLTLIANTYLGWLPGGEARARDLAVHGRLAAAAPMSRLVPHTDPARIGELCALIEAHVAGCMEVAR